ncbi:MAG: hypothetical protein LBD20_04035 [Spirochaetaceae bacterium]|jgi:hypothetical protein|nr:hypothetical protein [Spirochaetaceae bacterium]
MSQNGYDAVGNGEQLIFELESPAAGAAKNIVVSLYNGSIKVPVRFANAAENPLIKNGFDYTVTVDYNGSGASNVANFNESSYRVVVHQDYFGRPVSLELNAGQSKQAEVRESGNLPVSPGKTGVYRLEGIPAAGKLCQNYQAVSTFESAQIPDFTAHNGFIYSFTYNGSTVTQTGEQSIIFN